MFEAIFNLSFLISKLILLFIFGFKFMFGETNENKTLYYGIFVVILMLTNPI